MWFAPANSSSLVYRGPYRSTALRLIRGIAAGVQLAESYNRLCLRVLPFRPPAHGPSLSKRYLEQCGEGFEGRLSDVIARLALASAPDPAKMIAEAAAAASGGTSSTRKAEPPLTTQDRVRVARAQQSHAERSLLEFVKDLVGSFLADSFGIPSFARVLRVFVRTGFPASARRVVWKELGEVGLLHLLDPPGSTATVTVTAATASRSPAPRACSPGATLRGDHVGGERGRCADDAYLYPSDNEGGIIDAYLNALEHPRFVATGGGTQCIHPRASSNSTEGAEGKPTAVGEAAGDATASAAEESRGELEAAPSATALVPMWEVAVHHLACYLFPHLPPPATRSPSRDGQDEPPWRPDFGRRKTFERLLRRQHAGESSGRKGDEGAGIASSVAAAVLGYRCPGSSTPHIAGQEVTDGGGRTGGRVWRSSLGRSRCESLKAYCRASGVIGGTCSAPAIGVGVNDDGVEDEEGKGEGSVDLISWLEDGRSVEDAVERLARAFCS